VEGWPAPPLCYNRAMDAPHLRDWTMRPIGVIHTPFNAMANTPIQPTATESAHGTVEVFPQFAEGLADLEGFSHIYLIYIFHKAKGYRLRVVPYLDDVERGLFATRAPGRPNPLGLSIVRLHSRRENILEVSRLDILDGTPLLDIKPYVPFFDEDSEIRTGWLENAPGRKQPKRWKDDGRFG